VYPSAADLTKAQKVQPLDDSGPQPFSYGCLFLGANPLSAAWPKGRRLFSVDEMNRLGAVAGRVLGPSDYQRFNRIKWDYFFVSHPEPPDVLVVRLPSDRALQAGWEHRFLRRAGPHQRLKYLVVVERAGDILRNHSGAS
jgi:hypothetical protein